jgi:F-type H+-transporting ATPase subunit g
MELDSAKLLWKNRSSVKVGDAGVAALFGIELYA